MESDRAELKMKISRIIVRCDPQQVMFNSVLFKIAND